MNTTQQGTIRKVGRNARRVIARIGRHARAGTRYDEENYFNGRRILSDETMGRAVVTYMRQQIRCQLWEDLNRGPGCWTLHVHNNLWYDFRSISLAYPRLLCDVEVARQLAEIHDAIREERCDLVTAWGWRKVTAYDEDTGNAMTNNAGNYQDQRTFMVTPDAFTILPKPAGPHSRITREWLALAACDDHKQECPNCHARELHWISGEEVFCEACTWATFEK